jgi:RNA polymerase sigma-70 factor (ECF subfamily)
MAARDSIVRMVSRIVPPKEIEDIVQEAYVRICQMDQREQIQQPKSFLMTMARNLAYDHLKKAETRLADSAASELDYDVDNLDGDQVFDSVASHQEFSLFCAAIRQLPAQCRRVFVLKKVYGYSQKEIATEMKLSESTVEKHIALGIKRCTTYMLDVNRSKLELPSAESASVSALSDNKGEK